MTAMEKRSRYSFMLQKGNAITVEKHEEEISIPVPMPLNFGSKISKDGIIEAISHAPRTRSFSVRHFNAGN